MDEQDLRFLTLDWFLYDLSEESSETIASKEFPPGNLLDSLDGYIRHEKIQDSQMVQIDCSGNKSEEVKSLQELADIQKTILKKTSLGKLGSSWLVWGQLMPENQSPVSLAQEICKQLKFEKTSPNWQVDLFAEGPLLGATLYELWSPPQGQGEGESYHLLICLFDSHWRKEALQKRVGYLLKHCQHLFLYRHKVVWAFQQSRRLRESLQQPSRLVPQVTNQSLARLEQSTVNLTELQDHLRQSLNVLAVYATQLNYLQEQRYTIEINLENYRQRVLKLAALSAEDSPNPLGEKAGEWQGQGSSLLFDKFSQFAQDKYLRQIERDYTSLSPGLLLVENSIKAVESLNQIEQTRSDRRLNTTLTIASVGVATSAVVATVIVATPPPNRHPIEFQFTTTLGSLVIGGVMSIAVWCCLTWRRK
ncbi:hypothetical protein [Oscillatoria acuminata]|uniref:Uncharacterized protein n=1 Tax=Oscillatoria acuminata PCC 6304 TaxID=56110 RepID=K9TBJ8_9CYAN|nr:hypothetical protein [Oscillatoria acuminata]AFY79773.1 hypothetical protein Oscil6304_0013 [Oscillatoria acuminata PCC 6304]